MDVRAADTANLAAQRVEMERLKAVKAKQGIAEDRIATHTAAEANGDVSKPRPPKDPRDEHKRQSGEGQGSPSLDVVLEEPYTPSEPSDGEHILDVKV